MSAQIKKKKKLVDVMPELMRRNYGDSIIKKVFEACKSLHGGIFAPFRPDLRYINEFYFIILKLLLVTDDE
jgi:hypothetical protein